MRKLSAFAILFALCIILFAQDKKNNVKASAKDNKEDLTASALTRVNYYRSMLGLTKAKLHPLLNKAAQAHADYCLANGSSGHEESMGRSGFTGAQPWDRTKKAGYEGEAWVIGEDMVVYVPDAKSAVDAWVDTVYHRIPFLKTTLKEIGYGFVHKEVQTAQGTGYFRVHVMDFYIADKAPADFDVVYPTKGQTDVPTEFGEEGPNPRPDGSQSSGYPITMTFSFVNSGAIKGGTTITCTKHSLVDSKGKSVDYFFVTPQNDSNQVLDDTIAIIPKSPLKKNEKYTVTINAKLSTGYETKKTWSFTTGKTEIRVPLR